MTGRPDHPVLAGAPVLAGTPVLAGPGRSVDVHGRGLGLREETFAAGRRALACGRRKPNRHEAAGAPILPRPARPAPGTADPRFIAARPPSGLEAHPRRGGFGIGPVPRTGAPGPVLPLHPRDPDGNLVEVSDHA